MREKPEPPAVTRVLTEAEVRAAATMMALACQHARRTIATWNLSKKRPPGDAMFALALDLKVVEETMQAVARDEATTADIDRHIAGFAQRLAGFQ